MLRDLFEAVDYQELEDVKKHYTPGDNAFFVKLAVFRSHLDIYEWFIEQGEPIPHGFPYLANMYIANNQYRPELPITVSLMHPWTILGDIYDRIANDYMYDANVLKYIAHVANYALLKRIYYEMPMTPGVNNYITRDFQTSKFIWGLIRDYGDVWETSVPEVDEPQEEDYVVTDQKRVRFDAVFWKRFNEIPFDSEYVFSSDHKQCDSDIEGMSINLNTYYRRRMAYYARNNRLPYKQCPKYEPKHPDNAYLDTVRHFDDEESNGHLNYNVTSVNDPHFKPRHGYNNQNVFDLPYWLANELRKEEF